MMKKLRLRKALGQLMLVGTAGAAAMLVQGNTRAGAEPQPDPAEVERFLAQLEAREAFTGEAERRKGHEKRLLRVVEDAANRAPSEAMINRIENSVVSRIG